MSKYNRVRLSKLALGLAIALAAAPAFAQNTSSALGGRITTATNQGVSGAEITITHAPSGTVSKATTDGEGRYVARGLRVGGPYTITVTKDGKTQTRDNVFLQLSDTNNVDAVLADATTIAAIQVTGTSGPSVFSPTAMGAGTNVTRDQIEALPSIGRSLQDYVRLDPRIAQTDKNRNEISAGGQNSRYNAIRVDGISISDTFGLESNSLPTPKQPVSMDAIEALNVSLSAADVTISGATGAVIDAVTKSGTNEFHGTVYGLYRSNDWTGKNAAGNKFQGFNSEKTYGVTFGGPLIQDRLFFFFNYEKYTKDAPAPTQGPIGSSASNIVNITQAQIDQVAAIARGYGFEPGSLAVDSLQTQSEEYAIKLDWNITESQRASFRYSKSDQDQANTPGFQDGSPTGGNGQLSLSSYWYNRAFGFDSYVGQLFSDWSENFSTEFKLSYRDYSAVREPFSNRPAIAVRIGGSTLNLGTETNTHANVLETKTWNAFGAGNLYMGDHALKFGFDYEDNDIYNLFGRRTNGVYTFNSIALFQSGVSSNYQYSLPVGGRSNRDSLAANWSLQNLGLFLQDTWTVNNNLTLTFGLRVDESMVDDKPNFNACLSTPRGAVSAGCPNGGLGRDNTASIDGNRLFQPRVGFNYTFDSARPTQVRGTLGLFQGSAATVWLSNPFSNDGRLYTFYQSTTGIPTFTADPNNQPVTGVAPALAIDLVDPDLGQPAVWKANLAFDHELPFGGIVASAELLLTRVDTAIYYEDLNLGAPTGVSQDGRSQYWNAAGYNPANFNQFGNTSGGASGRAGRNTTFDQVLIAKPTSKGEGQQLTVSLSKPMKDNWSWTVGYTFTNATEVSPLTSSTSGSQWGNTAVYQVNENRTSASDYEIKDRFTGALTYRHFFFEGLKTEIGVVYEGRTGRNFSYVFDNDANGDNRSSNDLLYIPASRSDVRFGSAAEADAFWAYVEGNDYLRSHKGRVADRNGDTSPWVNNFDMRISQELPGFFKGNKAQIWLDILNVGNMINKKWGQIEEVDFGNGRTLGVVEYGGVCGAAVTAVCTAGSAGKYVYRWNGADKPALQDQNGQSRWALQVGLRYEF
jgi:outer membrane receptor protein involved in Fe transport